MAAGSRWIAAGVLGMATLATTVTWVPLELARPGFEAVVFLFALIVAGLAAAGRLILRPRPVDFAVFLPALIAALQLLMGWTAYPFATGGALLRWAAAGVIFLFARLATATPEGRRMLLEGFAAYAAVLSALSLVQYYTSRGRFLWLFPSAYDALIGPFQNRNIGAVFAEIALPVVVWMALRKPATRALYITAGGLMIATVIATGSRAGSILLALELAILAFLLIGRRRETPVRMRLVGGVAAAAILFATFSGWTLLARRFLDQDPLAYRREAVQSSLAMLRDRPLTGFGMGTFEWSYPAYALVDYGVVLKHAHNDWLEAGAEGGVPFGVTLAAGAAIALRFCRRHLWSVGVPFAFAHALVDFPLQVDGVLVWILVIVAAAIGGREVPLKVKDYLDHVPSETVDLENMGDCFARR